MPLDDGRMTETCRGNNIRRGEEELLRSRTHNCFVNICVALHIQAPCDALIAHAGHPYLLL
jgi:hypothetical protein